MGTIVDVSKFDVIALLDICSVVTGVMPHREGIARFCYHEHGDPAEQGRVGIGFPEVIQEILHGRIWRATPM
jgi:hypothetical protein